VEELPKRGHSVGAKCAEEGQLACLWPTVAHFHRPERPEILNIKNKQFSGIWKKLLFLKKYILPKMPFPSLHSHDFAEGTDVQNIHTSHMFLLFHLILLGASSPKSLL
jgi:hypothetical protein